MRFTTAESRPPATVADRCTLTVWLSISIPTTIRRFWPTARSIPQGGTYDRDIPGTRADTSPVVKEFIRLGWTWGGNWTSLKDYMHFEKKLP
ncbi:MAG: M15 family metallopeptidase [Odoribacter splanchnicus]